MIAALLALDLLEYLKDLGPHSWRDARKSDTGGSLAAIATVASPDLHGMLCPAASLSVSSYIVPEIWDVLEDIHITRKHRA